MLSLGKEKPSSQEKLPAGTCSDDKLRILLGCGMWWRLSSKPHGQAVAFLQLGIFWWPWLECWWPHNWAASPVQAAQFWWHPSGTQPASDWEKNLGWTQRKKVEKLLVMASDEYLAIYHNPIMNLHFLESGLWRPSLENNSVFFPAPCCKQTNN